MKKRWMGPAAAHALKESPREACGLVVVKSGKQVYMPCKNIAEHQSQFILDPLDYAAAEDFGDIVAVVHSHPNSFPYPSQADLVGCEVSGLPWFIYSVSTGLWERIEPKGYKAPLIGRSFVHGLMDCYTIIQDWYLETRGIKLPHFDRGENWWLKGQNLYMDHFKEVGFEPIPDGSFLEPGDIILMQIRSKVVNHGGIYLGRDVMLHHAANRLSCREVYGGFYKKNTRLVVRYKGQS